jgi:hypothetical protein
MLPLAELERRCQKPDHRRVGNWMARRIARPLALRVTRVVLPLGIGAHALTLAALLTALAGAAACAAGTPAGLLLGALLLQVWYLLDHVDGQVARFRRTESLDGAALDYLMHHLVNVTLPFGIGWGLFVARTDPAWLLAGFACGVGLLVLGLQHDVRYKAFIKRLKRVDGALLVRGGGGAQPAPPPPAPRHPLRWAAWSVRKACEIHVVMNLLTAVALVAWLAGDARLHLAGYWLLATLLAAAGCATASVLRRLRRGAAEREFAAWYAPPPGHDLIWDAGWWHVRQPGDPLPRDASTTPPSS